MTQALGIDIFRTMWQNLALVELDSDKFRCFMFSGLADTASSNEIRRKSTSASNNPYPWTAEIRSKIERKPVFKNPRKKAWHFDEQGFLIRSFSKPDTASPLCRNMFWESYVAPTRRSENFFEKKIEVERSRKCGRGQMKTCFANAEKSVATEKSHFGLSSNEACSGCKLWIQNRFS